MESVPDSVLIIKMSSFGDIICALPTLRALREHLPRCRIGWVVDERFAQLVRHDPAIDRVFVVPLRRWVKLARSAASWAALRREISALRRELRRDPFDVSLDLQGILKSGIVARAAGCPRNYQMATDRLGRLRWVFPGVRCAPDGEHTVDRMLPLAAALGARTASPRFDVHIPEAATRTAASLLPLDGRLLALNPTASAPHRTWPPERYAALARRANQELGLRIVVLGGPGDVEVGRTIAEQAGVPMTCTAGKTDYLELAAVLERCDLLVSSDTGPQHLAAALGKPVVALFGPSVPERTGPYGSKHTVIHHKLPCHPCFSRPTCKTFDCMRAITVDEVFAKVAGKVGG